MLCRPSFSLDGCLGFTHPLFSPHHLTSPLTWLCKPSCYRERSPPRTPPLSPVRMRSECLVGARSEKEKPFGLEDSLTLGCKS